jgi:hypothetical protein
VKKGRQAGRQVMGGRDGVVGVNIEASEDVLHDVACAHPYIHTYIHRWIFQNKNSPQNLIFVFGALSTSTEISLLH